MTITMRNSSDADGVTTREPGTGAPAGCWRIDDLAQKAGVTVDTIRYYQREGLLPQAERFGRANLYGPHHLERLDRIRELQGRRFSLAAIRALLDEDRPGLEGIFGDAGGCKYSFDELVERSGIDRDLADVLHASGLLRDPGRVRARGLRRRRPRAAARDGRAPPARAPCAGAGRARGGSTPMAWKPRSSRSSISSRPAVHSIGRPTSSTISNGSPGARPPRSSPGRAGLSTTRTSARSSA